MKTEPGKDFDPPACETGMMLLRRWANADPTLARFFPDIPEGATKRRPSTTTSIATQNATSITTPRSIPLLTSPLQLSECHDDTGR